MRSKITYRHIIGLLLKRNDREKILITYGAFFTPNKYSFEYFQKNYNVIHN